MLIDPPRKTCPHVSMSTTDPTTRRGLYWLGFALLAATLTGSIGYALPGDGHQPIVGALIWTGSAGHFLVFLIPLFARPLRDLYRTGLTARLMRWRRNAGIVYGAIQTVHLVIVCGMFVTLADPPTETIMVIVGALGLLLAIAMLITSFPGLALRLGANAGAGCIRPASTFLCLIYVYDFVVEPLLMGTFTSYGFWAALTLSGMLVRVLACFNFGNKPVSKPLNDTYQLPTVRNKS